MARVAGAAEGRTQPADLEAALERARDRVEALAATAAELEAGLPEKLSAAVRESIGSEARPLGRQLAELRGLMNQVVRRLERIEGDLLAERHARIDDLALLVDLVSSGWKSVDDRLGELDRHLRSGDADVVYPLEQHPAGEPTEQRADERIEERGADLRLDQQRADERVVT